MLFDAAEDRPRLAIEDGQRSQWCSLPDRGRQLDHHGIPWRLGPWRMLVTCDACRGSGISDRYP
jgi:hypothetical protein